MGRMMTGMLVLLFLLPVSVTAAPTAPATTVRPVATQPQQLVAQETQQQSFSIVKGTPFKLRIGVTAPGPVYVDLSWRGVPLEVRLQGEATQQVVAAQSGAGPTLRLVYNVTPTDLQRGYFWLSTVYIAAGYKVEDTKAVLAQGTIRAIYPKPDQRLLAAAPPVVTSPAAQQQAAPQTVAGGRLPHVPLRYVTPRLANLANSKILSVAPVNLNQRILKEARQPIPFRPFTMEEVFDLQTGKPLFARNIDERTGELILPPQLRTNVTVGRLLGAQDLQQKGFSGVQLKAPGAVRFGKLAAGPLTLKSKISIPRRDGMVSEAGVEDYLRELNDFEQQLNAIGQTLRDPQTGKIKTQATVTTIGKLQRNEQLLQQQLQKTRNLLDARTVYRPWTVTEIKGFEQKALSVTPKRLLAPRNTWKDLPPGVLKAPPGVIISPVASRAGFGGSGAAGGVATVAYPDCYLTDVSPDKGFSGMEVVLSGHNLAGCQFYVADAANIRLTLATTAVDATKVKAKIPQMQEGQVKFFAEKPGSMQAPATTGSAATATTSPTVLQPHAAAGIGSRTNQPLTAARQPVAAQPTQQTVAAALQQQQTAAGIAHAKNDQKAPGSGGAAPQLHTIPFEIIKNVYAQAGTGTGQQAGNEPPPDYFSRNLQPFKRELTWGQDYGDPASFAVGLKTEFAIYSDGGADDNLVRFKGYGGALGTLFNNQVEIIAAKGDISIPTGNTKNDNDLRANFRITAGGYDFYKWGKNKNQQTGTEQGDCAAEDKDSSGKCCNQKDSSGRCSDDGYVVQVRFEYKKHYELAKVDYSAETNFTLGPVPMVARFGFRGEAGADLHAVVSPLQVIGKVTPYIKTSVYGECGVDLWFAEGGVGVNMTMLNMTVDAAGQAYLNFGTLAFDVDAYVYLTYDALSGYVYAYVDAFGNRWKWDIANWSGFKGNIYLLPVIKQSFPLFPGA